MNLTLFIEELNKISNLVWIIEKSDFNHELYHLITYDVVNNINIQYKIYFPIDDIETNYHFIESYFLEINNKKVNLHLKLPIVLKDESIFISKDKSIREIVKELNENLIINYISKLNSYVKSYLI